MPGPCVFLPTRFLEVFLLSSPSSRDRFQGSLDKRTFNWRLSVLPTLNKIYQELKPDDVDFRAMASLMRSYDCRFADIMHVHPKMVFINPLSKFAHKRRQSGPDLKMDFRQCCPLAVSLFAQ